MVIGTSAGGLIALALACGYSARELKKDKMIYIIKKTFEPSPKPRDNMHQSKFDATNLEKAL